MLLAQVTNGVDWQSLAQVGFSSGLAWWLITQEIPKQRDEDRKLITQIVDRHETAQKEARAQYHADLGEERAKRDDEIRRLTEQQRCHAAQFDRQSPPPPGR